MTEIAITAASPTPIDRALLDSLAKTKHGKCTLPSGRILYFLPGRRSRVFALESRMYDDAGKMIDDNLGTRPARLLAGFMCDAEGKQLYRDEEWQTVDALPDSFFIPAWDGLRRHLDMDAEQTDDEKK